MRTLVSTPLLSLTLLVVGGCKEPSETAAAASASSAPRASSAPPTSGTASVASSAAMPPAPSASAAAPPAAPSFSFFSGAVASTVKLKPIRGSAIAALHGSGERVFFSPVEGWPGGSLPGNKYMASKEGVTFRVTATRVDQPVNCAELRPVAAMAPAKIKELKPVGEPQVQTIGKGYLALVGACEGQGPKGRAELHYAGIEMKDPDGAIWNAVLTVAVPDGASPELREEAAAWGRTSEFKGPNNRK
jgi:hypothetical protein